VPDLALDGITGYSFEVGDVAALAQAMKRITRFSNERAEAAARCLEIISNYTPERAATQILDGCLRMVGTNG
jgi:glycosyltransferase involved in cell wall biosynthesis